MVTTAGAFALDHTEHGGKIWVLCCGPIDSTPDIFYDKPWIPDPWEHHLNNFEYLAMHYAWTAVYLPAGHML